MFNFIKAEEYLSNMVSQHSDWMDLKMELGHLYLKLKKFEEGK